MRRRRASPFAPDTGPSELKGTMRYLLSVIDDRTASALPDEIARIDAFNDKLREEGKWILAAGLADPETAVVVDGRGGGEQITPGPVTRSIEFQSGFWIVEAASDDDARSLALEGSAACNRKVEVRRFL